MRTSRVHTKNTRLKRAIEQLHQTTHDLLARAALQ